MAALRGPRLQAGSAAWIAEERSAALQIAQQEAEEFSYSARNELDWLNEHMAGIFDENAINFAEAFKTPGKLRGKTPRTTAKSRLALGRVPLSDVFAATPNGAARRTPHQLNRKLSPRHQSRVSKASPASLKNTSPRRHILSPKPVVQPSTQDSGYYGSQDIGPVHNDNGVGLGDTQEANIDHVAFHAATALLPRNSPSRTLVLNSPEKTFQTAREEQTTRIFQDAATAEQPHLPHTLAETCEEEGILQEREVSIHESTSSVSPSPNRGQNFAIIDASAEKHEAEENETPSEDIRSPSDGSSPIRPVVRKSSLNFASLPAREPLVGGKSIGTRVSRTSHLDHHRTSHYSKPTENKHVVNNGSHDDANGDGYELVEAGDNDDDEAFEEKEDVALHHTKTYTQRLHDQISMLGKSQPANARQSKSIPSLTAQPPGTTASQATPTTQISSPSRRDITTTTPGAFPEDEDDDWIEPPAVLPDAKEFRPPLPKSHSADIMEKIHGKSTVGEELMAKDSRATQSQEPVDAEPMSPIRTAGILGHRKSASSSAAPAIARTETLPGLPLTKAMTVSNPIMAIATDLPQTDVSPKSPSRSFRESPLKQVKNKFSSILKSSKGLLASSAAISAHGKSSMLSPSPGRLGFFTGPSMESVASKFSFDSPRPASAIQSMEQPTSPTRPVARRTRASIEREKEEKRREKEAKLIAEQIGKLEKAREKEREKARVFSKDQDRTGHLEAQIASKKEQEALLPKETPKPIRTSPRKGKAVGEGGPPTADKEIEMPDAPSSMPPPSVPRSAGLAQTNRTKEIKRPMKPTKEAYAKPKQAPTLIRVNTGSQHSQLNPSSGSLAATAAAAPPQPSHQLTSKASKASLQQKAVAQNLKSSVSSNGRPRALELAAKKKEQDDREAQRRRDVKAEMERKRAAAQDEQRKQEQQRKQEAESQRQREIEQAEAKKLAQRQAAIEKAKQTRAPPPAVRSQLNGPYDTSATQERPMSSLANHKMEAQVPRPHSRMASGIHRSHDDSNRPVNAVLSNAAKSSTKRPLGADGEAGLAKRPPSRGGPAYQTADAKRRRTSAEFEDELEMSYAPNIKGPPVRPSGGLKKDMTGKSMFQNGYSNVPQSATRDLFKATVTAQHSSHIKTAHPLDMAQISKGAIPFAPNPNAAGPAYKTPARPGAFNAVKSAAKSVQRSSPRFQNGESIELPEIQTDDEDEYEEEAAHSMGIASWADSPQLRTALFDQETMDPSEVFGPPAPLNMEEVFNKSKDRFHKFRMRTSSANWSGTDRLTEDDIRKDMAARDKMRREGGWSYEMSKDML